MTASTPNSIFKPEPNVTHEITLASPNGLEVRGQFGPQMLFSRHRTAATALRRAINGS